MGSSDLTLKILAIGDATNNFYLMQKYGKNFEIHLIDFPKKGVEVKAHSSPSGDVELFDSLLISKQVDKIKQIKDEFDLCIAKPWAGARIAYLAGLNYILYFTGSDIITPPFVKNPKHTHGGEVTENFNFFERGFYRKVFDSAIACVSTSDSFFLPLQRYRKDAIRIDRICVDTELFNENVSKYDLQKKKFTIFAPQRLGLEKGYDVIWDAINLCKSNFDFLQVKWFIESNRGGTTVTDPSKLSKITMDLYENAPSQVKFIPLIDHKDLGKYFTAVDVIMGQMRSGDLSGIEREASFCKKPVISYNDPNRKTILDGKNFESSFLPKSRDPNELATIIYTSGTTGDPKGVMHKFYNFSFATRNAVNSLHLKNEVFFSYLPLCHIAERLLVQMGSIYSGGKVCFAESLDTFAANLSEASPTVFLGVPRIWTKFQQGILVKLPQKKLIKL